MISSYITFYSGLGSWGINNNVVWGLDITTFIFWIGIGHSGTLISAILLLLRQKWRIEISRISEIMTIVAILTAGLIPLFHIGRFWLSYWILPYPNQMNIWTNFKSPLVWDFFAIGIYLISSILYFYFSLIPDLPFIYKTLNGKRKKMIYFFLSLGWKGTSIQWNLHRKLMILLAGLLTPLVISVHSIVSYDFSVTINPGWHLTIFPPYFVAGAIFSGCAMIILLISVFKFLRKDEFYVGIEIYDKLSKIILFMSLILTYSFFLENFTFIYNTINRFEYQVLNIKFFGELSFYNYFYLSVNLLLPNLLWVQKFRKNRKFLTIFSVLVLISMWFERYVIVLAPLKLDFINQSIIKYSPSIIELGLLIGSFAFFFLLIFIISKLVPLKPIND